MRRRKKANYGPKAFTLVDRAAFFLMPCSRRPRTLVLWYTVCLDAIIVKSGNLAKRALELMVVLPFGLPSVTRSVSWMAVLAVV